jgi:monoamine oxidase
MSVTRRNFLLRVGQAGGYSAAFATMNALGLLPDVEAEATEVDLPRDAGKGIRVVILGGGIAGLASAYELGKAGFECTLLEARDRPGGRNWTIRNGSTVEFADGTRQTAHYVGPNSYFNAGPARLPSIHKTILGYCRELDVALEVFVNTSRSTRLVSDKGFDGKPVEQRQVINDTRGYVAELLAKSVNQGALDQQLTKEDRERLLALLTSFGDLGHDYAYQGSTRSGVSQMPGAADVTQESRAPLDFHALLESGLWSNVTQEENLDYQATMFEPVGGMDRIPYAFAKKLGGVIRFGAAVKEIRKTGNGVRIVYTQKGAENAVTADYCICALPISILKSTGNDLSPKVKQAIQDTRYGDSYKLSWESKRFWEADYNIYGGICWLQGGPINTVWFPSGSMHTDYGVILSGYGNQSQPAFAALPDMEAKIAASKAAVERLFSGRGNQIHSPIWVPWDKIPYNLGSWVGQGPGYFNGPYKTFLEPDDRIYFAGDHCTHVVAWQEGAALSARRTVSMIAERVKASKA